MTEFVPDAHTAAFVRAVAPRYRIEREIARGGMSRVYLAHDVRHRRQVAVKVLPPDIATALSTQRFIQEIEIAAQLAHPNILPLYDSGEAAGRLYYVMPYVDGPSLRDLISDCAPYEPKEAIGIVSRIAEALDYAHARGVIHCDIKPANILFVAGQPVLADFGIALVLQAVHEPSGEQFGGTASYMSPEQAADARTPVDARSDLYALGTVFYEMLTGLLPTTPVPAQRRGSLWRRRDPETAPIASSLQSAIDRARATDRHGRFATAGEFVRALRAAEANAPSPAVVATVVGIMGLAASFAAWQVVRQPTPPATSLRPKRVVVAPFETAAADSDLRYVGVMAADWIATGLQGTGVVDVIPTASAIQAWNYAKSRRGEDPVKVFAGETDASIVVTGSSYRVGDSVRVQVQVTDVAGRRLIGAFEPVRAPANRAMPMIEDARTRTMGLLSTTLDSRIAASLNVPLHPPTFEAYREFSAGLEAYVASDFRAAQSRFGRAFDRDTTFATALLLASISASNNIEYATADSLLDRLAPRRSELTPIDRLWFDYRRALLRGKPSESLAAIRQLAAAAPGTKATYNLGIEALQDGYLVEAERALESLHPDRGAMRDWIPYWDALSRVRHLRGKYDQELVEGQRARSMYPRRRYGLIGSIRALATMGRSREIDALLTHADSLPPDPFGMSPAQLGMEAAMELRAHGYAGDAHRFALRSMQWIEVHRGVPSNFAERWTYDQIIYESGDWLAARDSAQALLEVAPRNDDVLGLFGAAAARLGDTSSALRALHSLDVLPHDHNLGHVALARARIAATLGQRDNAVAWLRQSFADGHAFDLWVHRDRDFQVLHGNALFDAVARPRER